MTPGGATIAAGDKNLAKNYFCDRFFAFLNKKCFTLFKTHFVCLINPVKVIYINNIPTSKYNNSTVLTQY
jgi:hypothetical protein